MNKAELERLVEELKGQILMRDRLLRSCYYGLQQLHGARFDRLRKDMALWAPNPNPIGKMRFGKEEV